MLPKLRNKNNLESKLELLFDVVEVAQHDYIPPMIEQLEKNVL